MKVYNTEIVVEKRDDGFSADYTIENVGDSFDQHTLRAYIAEKLKEALGQKAATLLIPAVGCAGGFPHIGSAKILAQELLKFCKKDNCPAEKIVVSVDENKIFEDYKKHVLSYIDHIQNTLGEEPYKTVDVIIEFDEGVVIIERSNPPYGWALPGGFVDEGEDLKAAAIREAKEETNCDLEDVREFNTYAEPNRDPRFHTISTVFIARGKGTPQSGDDAKNLKIVPYRELLNREYVFDHNQILTEYLENKQ